MDKIESMREEARKKLELARELLSADEVTEEMAAQAEALKTSAKEIIDRAAKLIEVLQASENLPEWAVVPEKEDDEIKAAEREAKNGKWSHLGEFYKAVSATRRGFYDPRLVWITSDGDKVKSQKDMAEGAMASGGALVPAEYLAELFKYDGQGIIVRPRARVIPMSGRSISMPAIDHSVHAVAGKSNFYGGVIAYWIEEAGAKEIEDITFDKIELVVHKLVGYGRVSDELWSDSNPAIAAVISTIFGDALEWKEDYSYLSGNGVGQPLGVIGAPGTFTQIRANGNQFQFVDAINMMEHFLPIRGGVWVMSQSVLPQLYAMVDPNGNYIWLPTYGVGASAAAPGTLLGYPVIFTEKTPTLGTTGDVLLCDFSQYLIGDRQAITFDSSIHERFRYDQTTFRMVMRVDGQEWCKAPVPLADGATQVSPFVELDAATA